MDGEIVLLGPSATIGQLAIGLILAVGPALYFFRSPDRRRSMWLKLALLLAISMPIGANVMQHVNHVSVIEWNADGHWRLVDGLGRTIGEFAPGVPRRIYVRYDELRDDESVTRRLIITLPDGRRIEAPGDHFAEVLELADAQGVLIP